MYYIRFWTSHNKRGIHRMSCDRHQTHSIGLKQAWTELVLKKSERMDGVFTSVHAECEAAPVRTSRQQKLNCELPVRFSGSATLSRNILLINAKRWKYLGRGIWRPVLFFFFILCVWNTNVVCVYVAFILFPCITMTGCLFAKDWSRVKGIKRNLACR